MHKPGEPVVVEDFPRPEEPRGGGVLVRVGFSGLCHTDVHIWEGHYGPIKMEERGVRFPLIMGHEIAGYVEEVGEEVTGLRKGDSVVVYPWIGDGTCKTCLSGSEHLCNNVRPIGVFRHGGFAEYVLVPHYRYVIKVGDLPLKEVAPLACAGITAYSALKKAGVGPDDFLVIIGVGGLGHLAVQLARSLYRPTIIAVDVRDEALEIAGKLGADYVVNASRQDLVEEVRRITNGAGADAVVDFVNITETAMSGFSSLRRGGRLVLLGLSGEYASFTLPLFPLRGIRLIGSYVGSLKDLVEAVELLRRGVVKPVVTEMRLEEVNEAINKIRERKAVGRIVLRP